MYLLKFKVNLFGLVNVMLLSKNGVHNLNKMIQIEKYF